MARTVQTLARAVVILRDHAGPTRGPRAAPGTAPREDRGRAAGPTTPARAAASIAGMTNQQRRLAGFALIAGGALAIAGFLAAGTLAGGSGDAHFTDPLWQPLYAVALAGTILTILGFPAVLVAQDGRFPRLTAVGYAGTLAALVMLNLGEGVIEGFVKPYLVTHGGIPDPDPAGFAAFEAVALVCAFAGLLCLGVAVLRAGALPRWIGALLIASAPLSFLVSGLPTPLDVLGDDCLHVALIAIGWQVVAPARRAAFTARAAPAGRTP
jgi:hypothetical protein